MVMCVGGVRREGEREMMMSPPREAFGRRHWSSSPVDPREPLKAEGWIPRAAEG